uniref:Uncharacterized protein n=1 Tax=Oryza brachyantha TaxID=4533 RepID=J3M507_ORYBR
MILAVRQPILFIFIIKIQFFLYVELKYSYTVYFADFLTYFNASTNASLLHVLCYPHSCILYV